MPLNKFNKWLLRFVKLKTEVSNDAKNTESDVQL
ncbi:protein of unknown function [Candidatus Nitrotoga arctica]|uniref:Uncharacterized protein n=1 Tax=Candidatus Nitrotoga arctica TaxID=453162 RepID=A0ABN8AN69_9PROT|nr:protein of unknown function [Candidatus Nitrotoga arctica]